MRSIAKLKNQVFLKALAAVTGLLVVGCSLVACSNERAEPIVAPFAGAPVTVTLAGKTLIIANNTETAVYLRVFPTDILPVIEWAPCIAPETCPVDQRIESGSQKRINLREIVREQTVSITVFWWTYLDKLPGASVPPMEMDEITVLLP